VHEMFENVDILIIGFLGLGLAIGIGIMLLLPIKEDEEK